MDLNSRPLPMPPPPQQITQITIQQIIELRMNLDNCPTKTPDLKETLAILDSVILTFTKSLNPGPQS